MYELAEWTTLIIFHYLTPRLRHPESQERVLRKNKIQQTKIPPFWFSAKDNLFKGVFLFYIHRIIRIVLF